MQLGLADIQTILGEVNSQKNLERKRKSFKSYEVYEGGLKSYVTEKIRKMYPKSWELYTISDYSLLKKIVDKKAKAYKEQVIRKLDSPEQSIAYQEIAKNFALNESMKHLDSLYNEHKYCMMGVMMDLAEDGTPVFSFMPLEPHEFDVIKDDKGNLKAVILSYPDRSIMDVIDSDGRDTLIAGPKSDEGNESKIYAVWTDSNFYVVEQKMNNGKAMGAPNIKPNPMNPDNINPWGLLPFCYIPMNDGANYPIPSPLAEQTIEINALLSVYLTSGNMQVGQLVLKHPEEQKINQATQGMMTVINLPQSKDVDAADTTAEYISPSPNMDGHLTSIMTFVNLIMDEQGIRSGSGTQMTAEKFSSGLDRALSEADVQDIIEDNQQLYARVEEQIYRIIKGQLASVNRNTFTDENLQVTYRKPKILVTETEVLNNLEKMEQLGLLEEWEKFVIVDPNMSEADAKAKLSKIKNQKSAAKEVNHADNAGPSNQGNRPQALGEPSAVN